MKIFKLKSKFSPAGDQPQAIKKLIAGLKKGDSHQTLLGVTGSGKTFTMANVIAEYNKPVLVMAPNKALAAQLYREYKNFFPENSVNYFVSYYDYYQPEAYMPTTDTYIEKESMINDEIDRLRHQATSALSSRKDVIIVASVSCIYNLGLPASYTERSLHLELGQPITRQDLISQLVQIQFERTPGELKRGLFRVRGDVFEIMPASENVVYRIELEEQKVKYIGLVDELTRKIEREMNEIVIFPPKHFVTTQPEIEEAIKNIKVELKDRLKFFEKKGLYLEAERLQRRTRYDMEMLKSIGYCHGIENYSRHLTGKLAGESPDTLMAYFPDEFLTIIDESHIGVPQVRGMYAGDRARKQTLIKYGWRLPSALDNRPLKFEEFEKRLGSVIFTTATPGDYEIKKSKQVVEQVIRPTGLIDPPVEVRPVFDKDNNYSQIDDVIGELEKMGLGSPVIVRKHKRPHRHPEQQTSHPEQQTSHPELVSGSKSKKRGILKQVQDDKKGVQDDKKDVYNDKGGVRDNKERGRVIINTLTKKMAEDLDEFLRKAKFKVNYIHSDIKTIERTEILKNFRKGKFDILIGVNLLREGLDLPEVELVAILDADREGFLRSEQSLVQTMGRAARNVSGKVILYADNITGSIKRAMREVERRRKKQMAYNKKHGIKPETIRKEIEDFLDLGENNLKKNEEQKKHHN